MAGIGPEIVLKALVCEEVRSVCNLLVIADSRELAKQALDLGLPCDYPVGHTSPTDRDLSSVAILHVNNNSPIRLGEISADAGRGAADYVRAGVALCQQGSLDALATAPLNKESLRLAGIPFEGHTEMLASLCRVDECLMSFFTGSLWVALMTTHLSLRDAI